MKVGIPREVKNHEYRVAITPSGVHELVENGHDVFVEKDAGVGSQISDDDYVAAGARRSSVPPTTSGARPTWCSRSRSPWPRSTTGCARA